MADVEALIPSGEGTQDPPVLEALDLKINMEERLVSFKGEVIPLRPKPFEALVLLMQHSGKPVSKQQLIDVVWHGRIVSDDVITRVIRDIRQALGLSATDKTYIRTVSKVGYQFIPALTKRSVAASASEITSDVIAEKGPPTSNSHRLVIGVLFGCVCMLIAVAIVQSTRSVVGSNNVLGHVVVTQSSGPELGELPAVIARQAGEFASLVERESEASHLIQISRGEEQDNHLWHLRIQYMDSEDDVGDMDLSFDSKMLVGELATALLQTADHLLRCLRDLAPVWTDAAVPAPARVQTMLLKMCKQSLDFNQFRQVHETSGQIAAAFPHNTSAQALHYLMLVTRSQHFIEGRRDVESQGYQATLNDLYAKMPEDYAQHSFWAAVHRFHQIAPGDHAEWLHALSLLAPSDWLSLSSRTSMVSLLRYSGRLKEASVMAEGTSRYWPAFATSQVQNLFAKIVTQGFDSTMSIAASLPSYQFARIQRSVFSVWSILYSNDLTGLEASQQHAPPAFKQCLLTFIQARQQVAAQAQRLPASCARLDATLRARMSAVLGDHEGALALVAGYDKDAIGPALTLHYSEYDRVWLSEAMWSEAERLGMVAFWHDTGIRPDICASVEHGVMCDRYLD